MRKVRYFLGSLALIIACLPMQKAICSDAAHQYIAQHKHLAMQEQRLTGIPASIKLSMALLESGCGQSYLATKGNNHFGIKWWNVASDGAAFLETFDDDKDKNGKRIPSRFVKFNSVEASYKKHSDVLRRSRYQILFTYSSSDYRSWALGLETCGYATAKGYGSRLIELIEKYDLTQYDLPDEPTPELISFQNAPPTRETEAPQYLTHEKRVRVVSPSPPQYLGDERRVTAVSQNPRSPSAKPPTTTAKRPQTFVESRYVNRQGQAVQYILTEIGEE